MGFLELPGTIREFDGDRRVATLHLCDFMQYCLCTVVLQTVINSDVA